MHRTDHWLTQLKRTTLPPHHLIFDTEAKVVRSGKVFEHRFACAFTSSVGVGEDDRYTRVTGQAHRSAAGLWQDISDCTAELGKLHVWSHNLAYDLRVSNGLAELVELGWVLEHISLVPQATWCAWRHGKLKLTCCDSMSWLPGPLEKIAADLGRVRPAFDYQAAELDALIARCREDCDTLAEAVCGMLNYIRANDLGPFRPTGSGQSHAALRRKFLPDRTIRVHTDIRALAAEREAMHTGRCEAWRHGKIKERLFEFDMNLAYCRIAAHRQVPGALTAERAALTTKEFLELEPDYCVLSEVEVATETPLVPVTTDDGVIWPVGRFTTTLWCPEVTALLDAADDVRIKRAWLYRRSTALQSMCLWLIDRLAQDGTGESPLIQHMLKHWARTVVGRCGLRYRSWEWFGTHPRPELCISYEPNDETGEVEQNMRIGRQMLQLAALTESYSSVPSIPGWVASKCRVELWELIQQAGAANVFYMDTDGLLVNAAGASKLTRGPVLAGGRNLEHKGERREVVIHGPRNVELGEERRLSGVPRRAIALGELTFEGETWSGLEYALETGRTDMVEVSRKRWEVTPTDNRRIHLEDGTTEPHRLETDAT